MGAWSWHCAGFGAVVCGALLANSFSASAKADGLDPCISDTQTPTPTQTTLEGSSSVAVKTVSRPVGVTRGLPTATEPATQISSNACVTEFLLPSTESPAGVAFGPDRNLWFVAGANHIDRLQTRPPYTLTSFPIPQSGVGATRIVAGPDGNMWFTAYTGQIGRILTREPYTVTLFPIPDKGDGQEIIVGPDRALWFTEYNANRVARMLPHPPYTIEQFGVPTTVSPNFGTTSGPTGITVGPDDNIWFNEQTGGKVARLTTDKQHVLTEFPIPTTAHSDLQAANGGLAGLYDLAVGPGGKLWFTETSGNVIGAITEIGPDHHELVQFPLEDPSQTSAIVRGPDDNMWFTVNGPDYRSNQGAGIGHILTDPPYSIYEYYDIKASGYSLVVDPEDDSLWFNEKGAAIGRLQIPCDPLRKVCDQTPSQQQTAASTTAP